MATQTDPKKSYKDTLNLPQTSFPMEAKLVQNEPPRLRKWQESGLYKQIQEARAGAEPWILHDGPPFANGDIHVGHLINKTLKDVIVRFRTMQGYRAPYVPGWDCHGLPIEHKIQQELGPKLREMSILEVRERCFAYAAKYVGVQSQQFQRLGILGQWDNPYLTMSPAYEAATLEVFARFVEAGLVYKQLKPVPWSISNRTALADAELEYQDVTDNSVYVEFKAMQSASLTTALGLTADADVRFLVWTTTPWTLPANLAIAVNPDVTYVAVRYSSGGSARIGVVAKELAERVASKRPDGAALEVLNEFAGKDLLDQQYLHPFLDRSGRILAADYVTTTDGTGLVHTAPGHGEDDYETGIREGLEIYSPVLHDGRFDHSAPDWLQGKTVWEANPLITARLAESGSLFAEEKISHSYPHDWRSKTPIIFRATEQWFVAIDKPYSTDGSAASSLRQRALQSVGSQVEFIPEWGRHRMSGMLQSRPDWCVSRQRAWGLPIPVFYNEAGQSLLTPQSVRAVAEQFAEKGSDAWFTLSPAELLGKDFRYPPGFDAKTLRKEKDIFDVWFESGSSWHAVLQARPYLRFPADLYLEGSDQHRGWFQLSLLPSIGATGQAPFKQVLTHGFVVKPDGTKVSKSDKEYVTATQEVDRHGADLLRLWSCSVDYQGDIPTSPRAIQEFGDKYRKIRNTLRYLLGNIFDFNPAIDAVEVNLNSLDGWASAELDALIRDVTSAYETYQLHRAFRLLHDFCAVQISAVYGNAMKDRLYCDIPSSPLRRRCQTVMHGMLLTLTKLLAPMIVFTADETWEHIAHKPKDEASLPSVHLADLPKPSDAGISDDRREEWRLLMEMRAAATLQLDKLKKEAGLNKASEAEIIFEVDDDVLRRRLQEYGPDLEDLVGAGFHSLSEKGTEGPAVCVRMVDRRNDYKACSRSWKRRPDVGEDNEFPDLCLRDAAAVRALRGK